MEARRPLEPGSLCISRACVPHISWVRRSGPWTRGMVLDRKSSNGAVCAAINMHVDKRGWMCGATNGLAKPKVAFVVTLI